MDTKILTDRIEKISRIYAGKFDIRRDKAWFVLKLQEEMGELLQSYLMLSGQARKKDKERSEIRKDFEHEVADVFCHVLLLVKHFNIDLEKVVGEKWLRWENGKKQDSDFLPKNAID